jgi:hypothetical protein
MATGRPQSAHQTLPDTWGLTRPSLISSLIQLRPEAFGAHQRRQTAVVTDPLEPRRTQIHRLGKRVGPASRSRPARERSSDKVSDNRQGQRWTPADTHGRPVPGQACCGAGSPRLYLASGRRGRRFKSGHPDSRQGPGRWLRCWHGGLMLISKEPVSGACPAAEQRTERRIECWPSSYSW